MKLDPKAANDSLIFPTEKTLSQMHYNDPAMLRNDAYNKKWLAVQGE